MSTMPANSQNRQNKERKKNWNRKTCTTLSNKHQRRDVIHCRKKCTEKNECSNSIYFSYSVPIFFLLPKIDNLILLIASDRQNPFENVCRNYYFIDFFLSFILSRTMSVTEKKGSSVDKYSADKMNNGYFGFSLLSLIRRPNKVNNVVQSSHSNFDSFVFLCEIAINKMLTFVLSWTFSFSTYTIFNGKLFMLANDQMSFNHRFLFICSSFFLFSDYSTNCVPFSFEPKSLIYLNAISRITSRRTNSSNTSSKAFCLKHI